MQQESRKIFINRRDQNILFPSNAIKTSKYNMLNFFPKAILLQFMRIANIYFLVTAVLQSMPLLSPLAPFSAISPLVFVLAVSLFREMLEDYRKHRNDDMINEQVALLYNNYVFQKIQWKEIRVGDIVQVLEDFTIPADLCILRTSDENGQCFLETSNLDGERNLKTKYAIAEIQEQMIHGKFSDLAGELQCDKPNNRIHKFQGMLQVDLKQYPISNNNILLRGTTIKNTKWVVGLVVYTGHDCKIIKSQGKMRYKTTHIERALNIIVIVILILQAGACIALSFFTAYNYNPLNFEGKPQFIYIYPDQDKYGPVVTAVISYFSNFLLLNSMVPISLIISLETLKYLQTTWMEFDDQMQSENQPFRVLNTMIHEELGKIEYVFTDKTGTLTSNNMEFRQCCIKGIAYSNEDLLEIFKSDNIMNDLELDKYINFFLCIIICHNVIVDDKLNEFQGSSPDEVALVKAAYNHGFKFLKRTNNSIFIKVREQLLVYEYICEFEFTSDRKRMSMVVKDMQTEQLLLFCKGADNIIWRRLDMRKHQEQELQMSQVSLKKYSKEGLRTLCMTYKQLDEIQFQDWQKQYRAIQNEVALDPEATNKLKEHESILEHELMLLGITALEDKLQEDVPEVIKSLHEAGIKVWMLTGDKMETAENIGHLCHLIDQSTKCFRVNQEDQESILMRFKKISRSIQTYEKITKKTNKVKKNQLLQQQLQWLREQSSINSQIRSVHKMKINQMSVKSEGSDNLSSKEIKRTFALIVEGDSIYYLLHSEKIQEEFLKIIPKCRTVICCRSTPNQKAEIVGLVKKNLKSITLAIGDGGNDVSMIQESHIGVGILGKEGNQAAMNSDYFFCQFKHLWRLLFVHGRWNLYRTSYFVNYFFFKNILFTFQQFYFAFFNAFSSQSFYEDGYLLNFNTLITAVAPVYYGVFDQDLDVQDSFIKSQLPRVYSEFKYHKLFGRRAFAKWYVSGLLCSALVFFVTKQIYLIQVNSESGRVDGLWQLSISSYWSSVFIVFMVIISDSNQFTWVTFLAYGPLSILAFFPVFTLAWNEFQSETKHYAYDWLGNAKFFIVITLIVGTVFIFKRVVNIWQQLEYPTVIDKVRREKQELDEAVEQSLPPGSSRQELSELEFPISIENQVQGVYNLSHNMGQQRDM
ncbi:unnamed protein product [Paramecium octaurelia]|uniref:Phospholipid-transporting ATPase n=1 Tax=Paramecium octaurelia TaxID=43137 RepID=A0A8S1WDP0_PAROT|nr:unnamed protein product [Paramecium octaurelia]